MDIIQVRSAIKSKIDSITDPSGLVTTKPIAYAYNIFKLSVDGFPACQFEPISDNGEILTNIENQRTYQWKVILRQEIASDDNDRSEGMDTILNAYKYLIEKLDGEWDFNGTVIYSNPANSTLETLQTERGFELVFTILLDTVVVNTI